MIIPFGTDVWPCPMDSSGLVLPDMPKATAFHLQQDINIGPSVIPYRLAFAKLPNKIKVLFGNNILQSDMGYFELGPGTVKAPGFHGFIFSLGYVT